MVPKEHNHCFHRYRGPIHMVLPPQCILVYCCDCKYITGVHPDHIRNLKNCIYKSNRLDTPRSSSRTSSL